MKKPTTIAPGWGNFKPVETEDRYRLIWRSWGPEKSGKDHFALTAPGPIAIQSFDVGLEGVVQKFTRKPLGPKEIVYSEYEFDKNDCSQKAAIEIRDRFVGDYDRALAKARTVLWDTETEVWEVARYAEFGEATDAPKNYAGLNAWYRDLIQRAYDTGVNLCLIQKVKERWTTYTAVDNRTGREVQKPIPSGVLEPVGFKEANYIVQANISHNWDKERGFVVNIVNCRQNMNIAGQEYVDLDFTTLARMVFPESAEEDWQ